jgi:nucleotide-binding universal stress UspA family protein
MIPTIHTILYATDLEPHAPGVLGYAVALAQRYDAKIILLHVVEPLGPTARSLVRNVLPPEQLEDLHAQGLARLHKQICDRLEQFRVKQLESADTEIVSEVRVVEGPPAETIMEQADDVGASLIVMGTHGRAGMGELMLGSVAHKLMQQSKLPVFLVPLRSLSS